MNPQLMPNFVSEEIDAHKRIKSRPNPTSSGSSFKTYLPC